MTDQTIVVVGGTSGIGLELAKDIVARGDRVVLTGRDEARARRSRRIDRRARRAASPSTSPSPRRSPASSPGWAPCTGSCSPRSSATRTPCATTTSAVPGDCHAQADRLHRGRARAARPTGSVARDGHRALRRASEGRPLPRLDDGVDDQRRGRGAGEPARARARTDPGQRACTRASSATARSGRRSRPACSTATRRERPAASSRRWPTSSTRCSSCCATRASRARACYVDRGWRLT